MRAAHQEPRVRQDRAGRLDDHEQLVRTLYIKDRERNFARKIREAKLAEELEDEALEELDPRTAT